MNNLLRSQLQASLVETNASAILNEIYDAVDMIRAAEKKLTRVCRRNPVLADVINAVPHADHLETIAADLARVAREAEENAS